MELQHTLGHIACPACDEVCREIMYSEKFGTYLFPAAAALWLASRIRIGPRMRKDYECYIATLSEWFGAMKLEDVHIGHVAAYQRDRQAQIRRTKQHKAAKRGVPEDRPSDGASAINHEISCLSQVLSRAGLWEPIKRFYEPLPTPKESPGIALLPEEEAHFFKVGMSRKRWHLAAACNLLSVNTTAGPSEIRHLRLRDLEIDGDHGSFLHIEEGVKNDFRKRPVPLNQDALWAARWLLDRAYDMGARDPDHYLLPHRACVRGAMPDPTRPMGSWKRAHYEICKEAGKQYPRLLRLRRYDFRHTACTGMLENPAISFTTIEHMMGHRMSSKTKRKYDHLRNEALMAAAQAMNRGHSLVAPEAQPVEKKSPAVVSISEKRRWART